MLDFIHTLWRYRDYEAEMLNDKLMKTSEGCLPVIGKFPITAEWEWEGKEVDGQFCYDKKEVDCYRLMGYDGYIRLAWCFEDDAYTQPFWFVTEEEEL